MPWTKYYDPKEGTMKSIFTWTGTIFELVLKRSEFWFYILWNIIATTLCIYWIGEKDIHDFEWDAAAVMQYVMTFFVTFYNDRCFERYNALYPSCQDFMDSVVFFVQEMNVSLYHEELQNHRVACTKYLLATVYEYYMIVCGGKLTSKSWQELISKGLLTQEEAATLEAYPGGQATFVLTSWVLFIIRDALVQNCLWDERGRHQQTVHIYNRHCRQIVAMLKAAHRIGYMMALPIPFAYYHLMNLILVFNIILLATFPALFRSYWTVVPFFVALLIYMGLREVSVALADPFNQDSVDFPIPSFICQTFDRTVCLLLAFHRPEVRKRVIDQVEQCQDFTEEQLKRAVKKKIFANDRRGLPKGTGIQCKWDYGSVFEDEAIVVNEKHGKKMAIMQALYEHPDDVESVVEDDGDADIENQRKEEERKLNEAKARQESLKLEIADLKVQLEKVRNLSEYFFDVEDEQHHKQEVEDDQHQKHHKHGETDI